MGTQSDQQGRRIIVIGGGIGGLSTALALQCVGLTVELYEQAEKISYLGAGLSLWPNAQKALAKLGLAAQVSDLGVADTSGGSILNWRGQPLASVSQREFTDQFGAPVIVVHRADLHQVLMNALQQGTLITEKRCASISQNESSVIVTFTDGTQRTADCVIGADGLRSVVRQTVFPQHLPRYAGYTAWRGVTHFDHAKVVHWGEYWGHGVRFGIAPLNEGRVYWFCTQNVREGKAREMQGEATKQHLRALFGRFAAPIPTLIETTPAEAILSNDIYDLAPLPNWTNGRITLLGDAAHAMTPNLGQGACQAIEDALTLADCLDRSSDIPTALQDYEHRRLEHTSMVVKLSRQIGQVGQWENGIACAIRNKLIGVIPTSMRMNSLAPIMQFDTSRPASAG